MREGQVPLQFKVEERIPTLHEVAVLATPALLNAGIFDSMVFIRNNVMNSVFALRREMLVANLASKVLNVRADGAAAQTVSSTSHVNSEYGRALHLTRYTTGFQIVLWSVHALCQSPLNSRCHNVLQGFAFLPIVHFATTRSICKYLCTSSAHP